jgi:hypothetical protein
MASSEDSQATSPFLFDQATTLHCEFSSNRAYFNPPPHPQNLDKKNCRADRVGLSLGWVDTEDPPRATYPNEIRLACGPGIERRL